MKEPTPRLLSLSQVSEELGVATVTLRRWVSQRRIAVVRLGRAVRVDQGEIERLIERGTVPALPERSAR
jgi:excisionase family DNA binding protein